MKRSEIEAYKAALFQMLTRQDEERKAFEVNVKVEFEILFASLERKKESIKARHLRQWYELRQRFKMPIGPAGQAILGGRSVRPL